ncbi:alpha/beta hydrolase [Acinetobacter variabilis]|uniref:alpha/beta fold hydrolase n=1 Tax=Acinetobacter TaxID=469 RepID=UPI00054CC225|nr:MULTISPECIES: alpha/beta fold hydrolase [Acinetobacter]AUX90502.1 alpha/beta hydrolase [Acinetobacter sp. ACNIH1]QKW82027.1 alpha/beta fold hydrolase [Acinetobacter sp. FDAARGOS_724]QXR18952.1 alpha/beta hydrolase [Acinetobacter variabilis]HAB42212.1 alpha/beta hydrolase [Acinetobacter sp.]
MNSIIQMDAQALDQHSHYGFFDLYDKHSFKQPARTTWIDGWKIEYMAIARPDTLHMRPMVIIGGAFQNFNSYKYCVEQLFDAGPIILIDLPSMGANQQITNVDTGLSAGTLELEDLAAMLGQWLDQMQLPKVAILGMSLGSVVASCLADQRPELVDRMILMGVMQKTRKSWRMLLEESLHLMKEQRMDEFGQAVILYLVNHARLKETRMSPTAKRLFFKQMSEFTATEQDRYDINCNRLLRLTNVPIPQCKVLVACGQYDSFTLPHENANFALQCPNMQYVQIASADHVPQLQRRKETMHLFATFLRDEPVDQLEGIIPFTREQMQQIERRGEERITVQDPQRYLSHRHSDLVLKAEIIDMNFFGVLLELEPGLTDLAAAYPRDLALYLEDEEGEFKIECLIFEHDDTQLRALFKHGSFDVAERLLRFVQKEKALQQAEVFDAVI